MLTGEPLPVDRGIGDQVTGGTRNGEGVLVMPAEPYYPTRSGPPALRLSFGDLDQTAMVTGVARLAKALDRLRASSAAVAAHSSHSSKENVV